MLGMSDAAVSWSPADHPYAIAVSEAQWWLRCVLLNGARIHDGDDHRSLGFSSRQIDARQLVFALCQVLRAEDLQQAALHVLGMDDTVVDQLSAARARFEAAVPDIQQMRNALTHFDEWARGTGSGPQKKDVAAGMTHREVASKYWRFDYDPGSDIITVGPYAIHVATALDATRALAYAVAMAARAVDLRNAAELHSRVLAAFATAGLPSGGEGDVLRVSPGADTRIWVSLDTVPGGDRETLSEQVIAALAAADLQLLSLREPQSSNPAERLRGGEPLVAAATDDNYDP